MTNQEAIEILQEEHDYAQLLSYVNEALQMAISALENIEQEKKINENLRTQLKTAQDTNHQLREGVINHSGIIRGIDDLGRILIPKSIREQFGIHDFDPLEIIAEQDGIKLVKY